MTDIEKERKAFEAWYVRDVIDPNAKKSLTEKRGDGNYASIGAYHAFQAWLARARSERVLSVDALEDIFTRIEWPPQEMQWVILREDFDALIAKAENTRQEKGK